MKYIKIYFLLLAGILACVTSCKDDSIVIVPEWETAVHGFGGFNTGTPQNFVFQKPAVALDLKLQWISIDSKLTVTKIDLYVLFNEPFTDPDGNPATAKHGGDGGKLFASYSGSEIPANRTNFNIPVSQDDLYQLYKDATFDYDKDESTPATPVFANPDAPDREPSNPFVKGDALQLIWVFTTDDGRVFSNWAPSVCNEFPGANCAINWGVICDSDLAGTYDVVSTFTSPGYFDSNNPDFQYGPGNDGSVANGVQTYNDIAVAAETAAATYNIPDITNGFEPIMWGNDPVNAIVADQCGTIVATKINFSAYTYEILPGSKVNADGSLTIVWQNEFGENGISTFTPQ